MDIEEFVKDVLGQITRSVVDNTSGGKTTYLVDSADGVSFDLAVTTASKESRKGELSGGLKVKVVGAEGSKSKTTEESKEQTSRVKFKVDMYTDSGESGVVSSGGSGIFNWDD